MYAVRIEVHATEHRHVVGAVDGDRDQLAGGAVGGDRGEAVGDRLAGAQLLDRRLRVVGAVAPVAVGGQRGWEVDTAALPAPWHRVFRLPLDQADKGQQATGHQRD